MLIPFKRLSENAKAPQFMTKGAAGADLYAAQISEGAGYIEYSTNVAVAIPDGFVGLVSPRSSISNTGWSFANSVGIIDSDYRGAIRVRLVPNDPADITPPYKVGDRVGQLVIVPIPVVTFHEVLELDWTVRGIGGYGSTNKDDK